MTSAGAAPAPQWRLPPGVAGLLVIAALLAALPLAASHGWPWLGQSMLLAMLLLALAASDWTSLRLPDALNALLAVTGLACCLVVVPHELAGRLAAVLAGFVSLWLLSRLYRRVAGRHGLGLGDAKLLGAAGAWIGLEGLPSVLLWGAGSALAAVAMLGLLGTPLSRQSRIPFGPFLAFATWLVWLHGPLGS